LVYMLLYCKIKTVQRRSVSGISQTTLTQESTTRSIQLNSQYLTAI